MGREWGAKQHPPGEGIDIHASLKRIAWAYGCSKKGSPAECTLLGLLFDKVGSMVDESSAERGRQHAAAAVDALLGRPR